MKPANVNKEPLRVSHATLERWSEESDYRSKCPSCPKGILLVRRDHHTFSLINIDNCIACGQRFIYTDKCIGGEPVLDVTGRNGSGTSTPADQLVVRLPSHDQ